jgi:trans-aconitate 2-methyltransferase
MWSPDQYEKFKNERSAPFFDLLALVRPRAGMRVVDLGCGTGELTRAMHEKLGAKETLGIDTSAEMLSRAAAHAGDGLRFERGDLGAFEGEGFDLVFSNAAVHWVMDHASLFARLAKALAPGGQLAVQMPANFDHPSHATAWEIAREPPFADALGGRTRAKAPVLAPEAYATLLHALGFKEQSVALRVYAHVLTSREGVVEWVKGTLLTEYAGALPTELYPEFLARYRARLLLKLEDTRPYLYTFKRILLWAERP